MLGVEKIDDFQIRDHEQEQRQIVVPATSKGLPHTPALLVVADSFYHPACIEMLKTVDELLVTTRPVVTEAFYLLGFSWKAQDNLWEFIARGGVDILSLNDTQQAR
jgi:hypothetical protein